MDNKLDNALLTGMVTSLNMVKSKCLKRVMLLSIDNKQTKKSKLYKMLNEFRSGHYECASCKKVLFKSESKYCTSNKFTTFSNCVENSLTYKKDAKKEKKRIECTCSNCGEKQGYMFYKNSKSTDMFYSNNTLLLKFVSYK